MKVIKRFGSGLFSAWPPLLILKRKVSGLVAVICLVGGRLFDHLYPSPPWAFHHLHLSNYSIWLKVGNMHVVAQAYNFCTLSHSFARRPTLPALNPPQAFSFLPHFASPLLPCSCALFSLSFQIWRGSVMNGALLLSSAGLVSLPQPIVPDLLVPTSVCPTPTFTCLWNPVALAGLKSHAIPHIVSL